MESLKQSTLKGLPPDSSYTTFGHISIGKLQVVGQKSLLRRVCKKTRFQYKEPRMEHETITKVKRSSL